MRRAEKAIIARAIAMPLQQAYTTQSFALSHSVLHPQFRGIQLVGVFVNCGFAKAVERRFRNVGGPTSGLRRNWFEIASTLPRRQERLCRPSGGNIVRSIMKITNWS